MSLSMLFMMVWQMKPKSRILGKTIPEKQGLEKNKSGEEKLRPCSIKNDKTTIIMLIESLKIYYNICCVFFLIPVS